MTNYINSIELDGTVYTVGPLKVDDYDNIVSQSVQLSSKFSSNTIIGSDSISYHYLLDDSSIYSNIVIGDPSVSVRYPTSNIVVGHGDTYMHTFSDSSERGVILKTGNASLGVTNDGLWLGPLSMGRINMSTSGYIGFQGPIDVYAVGTCVCRISELDESIWSGQVTGYTHAEVNIIDEGDHVTYEYNIPTSYQAFYIGNDYYYDLTGGQLKGCPTVGFSTQGSRIYVNAGFQQWVASSMDLDLYIYKRPAVFI